MPKPKTLIILLFSLLIGLLAVKAFSLVTRENATPPQVEAKAPEAKPVEPVHVSFSGSVPKGKRVVSIMVNEVSGATRALEQGDRVDVIAVTDLSGTRGGKIARVVLQNVVVHDVEQSFFKKQLTDKITRKKKNWTLQLLVNLSQAVTLASVDESAILRLVLRNPQDDSVEEATAVYYTPRTGAASQDGDPQSLPWQIHPGMRAISLPVNNSDGICDTLSPGDRVDIMVSFKLAAFVANEGNEAVGTAGYVSNHRKSSKIFLQDIEVLSTDQSGNTYEDKISPVKRVSLMVTPKQAEKIAVISDASKASEIRLILRHPKDREKIATRGELFSDQIIKDKRAYRVIDTIKGTKVHPRKFYE